MESRSVERDAPGGNSLPPIRKTKKKKKKVKKIGVGVSHQPSTNSVEQTDVDMSGLEGDIVENRLPTATMTEDDQQERAIHHPETNVSFIGYTGGQSFANSAFRDYVYLEKAKKFEAHSREHLNQIQMAKLTAHNADHGVVEIVPTTALELGIQIQTIFKTFSVFCNGLFSGFALCHTATVLFLCGPVFSYDQFAIHYQPFAFPIQCIYYLMFAICTVAAFDRYDIGRPTRSLLLKAITMKSGAIVVLFYLIGLLLSVSIARVDELIRTQRLIKNGPQEFRSLLTTWRNIGIARAVLAILSWAVISLRPQTDRLVLGLRSGKENSFESRSGGV